MTECHFYQCFPDIAETHSHSQSMLRAIQNQWRLALAEINKAMKSTNQEIKKGAEVILALAPNMLFRAPNSRERELSTSKMVYQIQQVLGRRFSVPSTRHPNIQLEGLRDSRNPNHKRSPSHRGSAG